MSITCICGTLARDLGKIEGQMVPLAEILGVVGERYLGWCSQSAQHHWTNDEPANEGMWAKGMPEKKNEDLQN